MKRLLSKITKPDGLITVHVDNQGQYFVAINIRLEFDGWTISYNPKSIPTSQFDYEYSHEEHDGTNGLCGVGHSVSACIAEIIETYYQRQEGW